MEEGEACDDGNQTAGDGCDAHCALEGPAISCPTAPRNGCRRPAVPQKARLFLRNKGQDREDRLAWEWRRGQATAKSEFGDPLTANAYTLCIYDASGLIVHATAPAGGLCGEGRACWKSGGTGFRYRDGELTPDGLSLVLLKAGPEGKAKILVEGRGAHLRMPALGSMTSPVTAQLTNGRTCWEAVYSAPFLVQAPGLFRDTAD